MPIAFLDSLDPTGAVGLGVWVGGFIALAGFWVILRFEGARHDESPTERRHRQEMLSLVGMAAWTWAFVAGPLAALIVLFAISAF